MKLGIWSYLGIFSGTILSQSTIFDQDKPLHIGVSIGFASRSHIKYLLEILEEVSKKGHRITYISTNEFKRFGEGYNVTHYSVGDLSLKADSIGDTMPFSSKDSIVEAYLKALPSIVDYYRASFPVYEKFYKEDKPDLIICDFAANSCSESAAKHAIPMMIGYQSLMFSGSTPYLTGGNGFEPTTIENYSFLQRMKHGIIDPIKTIIDFLPLIKALEQLREHHKVADDNSFPKFSHLGLGLANSFIGFENPRKIPSHINVIGPIVSDQVHKLPQDLQTFLDDHSKVLYVAFGSLVQLKPELAVNLLQLFQRALNDEVLDGILWGGLGKTNMDKFPKIFTVDAREYSTQSMIEGSHENIKFLKWAPQESILNHHNTKLFLSHGGLDSIYESLGSGTPMLVLPFIADQPRNGMLIKENGVGDYIEWDTMTDDVKYQKFVKLLDPNNLELQSKVRQLQLITKFSSKRKTMAADLIETFAYSAKSCRMFETAKPFEIPCEMKPFLPLDYKMSSIKVNLIDVYLVTILLVSISFIGVIYFTSKTIFILYRSFSKQKLD